MSSLLRCYMEEENKFKKILDEKNRPYLFTILMSVVLILFYLVPTFKTVMKNDIALISGFASLAYIQDRADMLYYSSMMNILGIAASCLCVVNGIVALFSQDSRKKINNRIYYALFIAKILFDILMIVFTYQTKTNVTISLGGFVQLGLSCVVFIFYLLLFLPSKKK